ncbi:hypothetical protein [Paenibacillus faecalis]|uniref:hypothetical protein n=1 Tax=Paenibacillus faecalis TaxID=2079532 RepID=UPI0018F884FE|nr:hypothetical protein [Paenibacillus faecalis]
MDEIRSYRQQARELREQAAVIQQSGLTVLQVRVKITSRTDIHRHAWIAKEQESAFVEMVVAMSESQQKK